MNSYLIMHHYSVDQGYGNSLQPWNVKNVSFVVKL